MTMTTTMTMLGTGSCLGDWVAFILRVIPSCVPRQCCSESVCEYCTQDGDRIGMAGVVSRCPIVSDVAESSRVRMKACSVVRPEGARELTLNE
jgi:hypothetical protein